MSYSRQATIATVALDTYSYVLLAALVAFFRDPFGFRAGLRSALADRVVLAEPPERR